MVLRCQTCLNKANPKYGNYCGNHRNNYFKEQQQQHQQQLRQEKQKRKEEKAKRRQAETEKLKAEAERLKAEAERLKAEAKPQTIINIGKIEINNTVIVVQPSSTSLKQYQRVDWRKSFKALPSSDDSFKDHLQRRREQRQQQRLSLICRRRENIFSEGPKIEEVD